MDYSNIYLWLKEKVADAATIIFDVDYKDLDNIAIEVPKDKSHGDLSTNAAMLMAKLGLQIKPSTSENKLETSEKPSLPLTPRRIAELLAHELKLEPEIESIDIAGPGFINITFKSSFWHSVLAEIIDTGENFGKSQMGKGEKVNIEFVSANPTGPLHIGHARGAIYGDALARVMQFAGFDITKEYYFNDAGSQITKLAESTLLRYKEAFGEKISIPEGFYPGEYLKTVAENIKAKFGDKFKVLSKELYNEFRQIVIAEMFVIIKADLADLKIKHDVFFSEASLHVVNNGKDLVMEAVNSLKEKGAVYEGELEAPKGEVDPNWVRGLQPLFKATDYGDVQDRSLTKSNGEWTYFAGDIAYAKSKIDRGFKRNLIVLGADHAGYVKRLQAIYDALSEGKASAQVVLCQMVNFIEDGKPVKMSKRAGNFTTVADVIKEVGADILRFIMLTRKNDIILDFDLDLVKTQSKENPVFYVQYGCVRALSVIENAKTHHPEIYKLFSENKYDLKKLTAPPELDLIKLLSFWVRVISSAASTGEVHKIAYYLQELASQFHSFWNLGKEFPDYRFIIPDNAEISASRLALVRSVASVIKAGLRLIGVVPLEKM